MSHIKKIITVNLRETTEPEIIMSNLKTLYGTLCKTTGVAKQNLNFSAISVVSIFQNYQRMKKIYVKEN